MSSTAASSSAPAPGPTGSEAAPITKLQGGKPRLPNQVNQQPQRHQPRQQQRSPTTASQPQPGDGAYLSRPQPPPHLSRPPRQPQQNGGTQRGPRMQAGSVQNNVPAGGPPASVGNVNAMPIGRPGLNAEPMRPPAYGPGANGRNGVQHGRFGINGGQPGFTHLAIPPRHPLPQGVNGLQSGRNGLAFGVNGGQPGSGFSNSASAPSPGFDGAQHGRKPSSSGQGFQPMPSLSANGVKHASGAQANGGQANGGQHKRQPSPSGPTSVASGAQGDRKDGRRGGQGHGQPRKPHAPVGAQQGPPTSTQQNGTSAANSDSNSSAHPPRKAAANGKGKGKGKSKAQSQVPPQASTAETLNPSANVFEPSIATSVQLPDVAAQAEPAPPPRSRRAAFAKSSQLTDSNCPALPQTQREQQQRRQPYPQKQRLPRKQFETGVKPDDLTSRLIIGLSNKPFLECPICFMSLLPHQPIWTCLPATVTHAAPAGRFDDKDSPAYASPSEPIQPVQGSCYTPFHLSCIADWAKRSLKDAASKELKEGEVPEWRCPGCQKKRIGEVQGYRCFCDATANPKYVANSLVTPHSCGQSCGRRRPRCYHPCPLTCHPGPCPPCQVPLVVPCPSHGKPLSIKCSVARAVNAAVPTCESICLRTKSCGKAAHQCLASCHEGRCEPCDEKEQVRCYCGNEERETTCGWNKSQARECVRPKDEGDLEVEDAWTGRFSCAEPCPRKFDCGIHDCPENCHDHPLQPLICPSSPSVITHCPCGRHALSEISATPRLSCLDPIATCESPCTKSRPCGHACPELCHNGECPPCGEEVVRPCRCGEGVMLIPCIEVKEREESGEEITCERLCKALRSCGRHECGRQCCPLAYKAKFKGKRRLMDDPLDQPGEEDLALHACPLVCGRPLGCGLHTCPKPDHKGACGRCLEASYDELTCHCTHTVVFPPVPCGTSINCTYPCARPAPACGHPKTLHTCHENENCPPCPYLRDRECACGKNPAVKNIRCSQERVSCGAICRNLLDCGFHTCEKSCHPKGECGECTQVCRKPKKICGHPCQAVCHAPARCPENEPCSTIVTQSCACGHLQNRGTCGASVNNPVSREKVQLKCVGECLLRQRNARLADALGIKPAERNLEDWATELKAFCSQNHAFVRTVEQTFKDFFAGSRQVMVLPHMPPAKRTFVVAMADVYRLGRELVDQEPQRSVQIRRRVDTRIPNPLLSEAAPPPPARPHLGGLANLRQSSASKSSSALNLKASAPAPVKKAWASGPSTPRVGSPIAPASGTAGLAVQTPLSAASARVDLPVVLPDDETAKDWDLSDTEA